MENGKPHYCESCHQVALAENIKYQERIKDLMKKIEELEQVNERYKIHNEYLSNNVRELKSNKNGLLKTIKHLEKEIKDTQFIDDKVELAKIYDLMIHTYNKLEEKEYKERREMYYARFN